MLTVPHAAARTGVPVEAPMSRPSWFRPQRGPNSDVTGPLTGRTIVVEPQPRTVVVPGAGFDTGVVAPGVVPVVSTPVVPVVSPTVPEKPAFPWAASWLPACWTVSS